MGTAQNQCINIFLLQFLQISRHNFIRYRIMKPSLFHKRHKKRTCLSVHCDLWIKTLKIFRMDSGSDGPHSANNSNLLIPGLRCRNLRSRKIKLISHCIQSKCTGCITRDHNRLYLLFLQKADDLAGISDDSLFRFTSIRHSRRISKIYNFL